MISYDIHLGTSKKSASLEPAILRIDERVHDWIFMNESLISSSYPLLYRMHDFYKDSFYQLEETKDLIKEMNLIKNKTDNLCLLGFVSKVTSICHLAIEQNVNIYGFSP
jgi:hypothetical protein